MLIGYARTSTTDQVAGLEAQVVELQAIGCEKVYAEQVSSIGRRPQLEVALGFARQGDTFIVTKPDRLARNTAELLQIVEDFTARGIRLRVLSMGGSELDTGSATGKLMLTMLGAIASFERELMLERQREGIRKARNDGKYKGRAPTARRQASEVMRLKAEGVPPSAIAAQLGIGRASVYRILGGGETTPTS